MILYSQCGCISNYFSVPTEIPASAVSCFNLPPVFYTSSSITRVPTGWQMQTKTSREIITTDQLKAIFEAFLCHERIYDRIINNVSSFDLSSFRSCPNFCLTKTYAALENTEKLSMFRTIDTAAGKGGTPIYIVQHYNFTLNEWRKRNLPTKVMEKFLADLVYEYKDPDIAGIPPEDFMGIIRISTPGSESFAIQYVTEGFAYPLTTFLSDVGGIAGLWIGLSVLTFVELTEFIAMLIAANYLGPQHKDE
ncbi:hypothetical protein Ciccas_005399 [Cichlidogyrus casuarinus]|uniref:Uncharacterized protein n=1 Tax=Cichlidogyrus casuarinus TaxID=1844966 RepID=A0ABD2Q8R1_9PLAT